MPTPISAYPAPHVPVAYAPAPVVPVVDDIRPSDAAGRARTGWRQDEPATAPPPSSNRFDEAARYGHASFSDRPLDLPSGAFLAQRIAQESESEETPRAPVSTALAAYLRMRDSHIALLPAHSSLDVKI